MVDVDVCDFNCGKAIFESLEMVVESEDFTVVASDDFVNAVAEECSSVEVGGADVIEWYDFVLNHR